LLVRKLELEEILRLDPAGYQAATKTPVVAVLDNIRSRNNVGSIFRSADAFRLTGLALCGYTPTPPHRDIRKTALGAEDAVPWSYFDTTTDALAHLRAQGYTLVALEHTSTSQNIHSWQPTGPIALLLGNEVEGAEQTALDACDLALEIPQFGTKHSLNVGVAAGIAFCLLQLKVATGLQ
jgi:tRNA G18 (ribose-2'-O)-methylase SpoU